MARSRASLGRRYLRPGLVLALGLLATTTLSWTALRVQQTNERSMLQQRASEAAAALQAILPVFSIPMASSAAVVGEVGPAQDAVERVVGGLVGPDALLRSASVWALDDPARPRAAVGDPTVLAALPEARRQEVLNQTPAAGMGVVDLTGEAHRALGLATAVRYGDQRLIVYLEAPLPDDPTDIDLTAAAFDDLDYVMYLGPSPDHAHRVSASTTTALPADAVSLSVPFGDSALLLRIAPRHRLGGSLLAQLPWVIALVGGSLTLAVTWLTWRLQGALEDAAGLATENEDLYLEQRRVAERLQRDLLPGALPVHGEFTLAHRYQAGAAGVIIGGDWYDAQLVDDHVVVSVGDVSGQGLAAAAVMATLRLAVRAYAAQGDGPGEILAKLNALLDVGRDGHFATVLCGSLDLATGALTLASAGHPPPVVGGEGAELVPVEPGFPVGVRVEERYAEHTVSLAPGSLFVAYTDGLFERHGETVSDGLERVRACIEEVGALPLEQVVDRLTLDLRASEAPDDTAVLALRMAGPSGA